MGLVRTDAIVLRSYNLAEADRIVLCLTRSAGLVRAVARGARKMKSRFGAALEPFTLIRLEFYEQEHRELVTVVQTEIVKSNFGLASQPEIGTALAYVTELVSEFAPPHEVNDRLYRMVTACVEALGNESTQPDLVVRYFEVWLLRLAGLLPDLGHCASCDKLFAAKDVVYLDPDCRACCYSCARGLRSTLSAPVRLALSASQKLAPAKFVDACANLSKANSEALAAFTQRLIVNALDRRPRTLVSSASR